jgi:hypothetical protein
VSGRRTRSIVSKFAFPYIRSSRFTALNRTRNCVFVHTSTDTQSRQVDTLRRALTNYSKQYRYRKVAAPFVVRAPLLLYRSVETDINRTSTLIVLWTRQTIRSRTGNSENCIKRVLPTHVFLFFRFPAPSLFRRVSFFGVKNGFFSGLCRSPFSFRNRAY